MSLKKVYHKIQKIKSLSGTNDKVECIREFLEDENFKQVMKYAYNSQYTYGVKSLPKGRPRPNILLGPPTVENLFKKLDFLIDQPGTSKQDKDDLINLCKDQETLEVLQGIILKDFKMGIKGKSLNKAKPGLVYIEPYQRSITDPSKISFPAFSQEKADGMFVNIKLFKRSGKIQFISRNGRKVKQLGKLRKVLKKKIPKKFWNSVIHGELLIIDENKVYDREKGNGIFNSCIHGTSDQEMADKAVVRFWDIIPLKNYRKHHYDVPYKDRLDTCYSIEKIAKTAKMKVIDTIIVDSIEQAKDHYKKLVWKGKEGNMLKDFNLKWKFHNSPLSVKGKEVNDAELRISGVNEITDKFSKKRGLLGSLECESEDGKLKVRIGSGINDADREKPIDWWQEQVGGIITAVFNYVCEDKKRKDIKSMYLPRFPKEKGALGALREDRTYAETLEEILSREQKKGKNK